MAHNNRPNPEQNSVIVHPPAQAVDKPSEPAKGKSVNLTEQHGGEKAKSEQPAWDAPVARKEVKEESSWGDEQMNKNSERGRKRPEAGRLKKVDE